MFSSNEVVIEASSIISHRKPSSVLQTAEVFTMKWLKSHVCVYQEMDIRLALP